MDKKIIKMKVFDFDGTLINSPLPDKGRDEYKTKTGKEWPHVGWWGKADSLDMDIFDIQPNPEVLAEYQKAMLDEEAIVILLTGRMTKLRAQVDKILTSHGLVFHEIHLNHGGSTDTVKIKTLSELLDKYPTITDVELWDDRASHQEIFNNWGFDQLASGRIEKFKLNLVLTDNPTH